MIDNHLCDLLTQPVVLRKLHGISKDLSGPKRPLKKEMELRRKSFFLPRFLIGGLDLSLNLRLANKKAVEACRNPS